MLVNAFIDEEKKMRTAFADQAAHIREHHERERLPHVRVGLEVEYHTRDADGPAPADSASLSLPFTSCELGTTQIEAMTPPVLLDNPDRLAYELHETERLLKAASPLRMTRIGAVPDLHPDAAVTQQEKYVRVPAFHDANRPVNRSTVVGNTDFLTGRCVGLFQSVQVNLQAESLDAAVDLLNQSFARQAPLIAMCANAPMVDGIQTGFADVRIPAWRATHDLRTDQDVRDCRIGLPRGYIESSADYFARIGSHDFVLYDEDHALDIGVGLCWWDSRIKFKKNRPIVEFRPLSTQPSVDEDIAASLAYIGRMTFATRTGEPLPSWETVEQSSEAARRYGMKSGMLHENGCWLPTRMACERWLDKAQHGLQMRGFLSSQCESYLRPLLDRARGLYSPADQFTALAAQNGLQNALRAKRE